MSQTESSNVDRLEYLYINMVGLPVQVYTVDGKVTEGIFLSRTDDDVPSQAIFLASTRNRESVVEDALSTNDFHNLLSIPVDSIVMVEANHVRVETAAAGRVEPFHQTQLDTNVNWADMQPEGEDLENEEAHWEPGQWDQFGENEKKFNVKSTYQEDFYTTKLDPSKFTKEQRELAARMAREIEGSQAKGGIQHRYERGEDVDVDEGELFSNVQRNKAAGQSLPTSKNAYVPPAQRNKQLPPQQDMPPRQPSAQPDATATAKSNEGPPAPIEAVQAAVPTTTGNKTFNVNAPAFKPFGGAPTTHLAPKIISDLLQAISENLEQHPNLRRCTDWPGDDEKTPFDQEDSDYASSQFPPAGFNNFHHGGAGQGHPHHHHHHHQTHHHHGVHHAHHQTHHHPAHHGMGGQQGYPQPHQAGFAPSYSQAKVPPQVPSSVGASMHSASHYPPQQLGGIHTQHMDPMRPAPQQAVQPRPNPAVTPVPKSQQPQQPVSSAPSPVAEVSETAAARRPQGFTRGAKAPAPMPRSEEPPPVASQQAQAPVGATLASKKKGGK